MLRLEQGDLRSASALMDASITELKSDRGRIPEWRFYHARGRLRLAEGRLGEAHSDFRLALELARNYRLAVPASDATRVSLEGMLHEVYASFAGTGRRLYVATGHSDLARETFEAIEENRAGSLAARLHERKQFRRNLTPAYWDQLARSQAAESAALLDRGEGRSKHAAAARFPSRARRPGGRRGSEPAPGPVRAAANASSIRTPSCSASTLPASLLFVGGGPLRSIAV